jgi:hypothetical protein
MAIRDEEGIPLKSGDYITFTFGIPPICVLACLSTTGGELWIDCLTPEDVRPKREPLSDLIKWYQVWKASLARVDAFKRDYKAGTE